MTYSPDDPYRNTDLYGLGKACGQYADELQTRRTRTPAERAQLAEGVATLLRAIAGRVGHQSRAPGSAEYSINSGTPLACAYGAFYLDELRRVRYGILNRAADFVFENKAATWLWSLGHGALDDDYARAIGSDVGMAKQLKGLEVILRSRTEPPGNDAA